MARIKIRLEIEVDEEWAAMSDAWIAEQAERMIDNNSGGHATAYILEIEKGIDEEDET